MKVLLLKDVYKLGHAGEVKKVADGYGRNYLMMQGLAVLATPGALKTVDRIKAKAAVTRAALNQEMGGLAGQIEGLELVFTSKAGETGKLYGSITAQMIIDAINQKLGTKLERHQVEAEPIRTLGEHPAHIQLTVDLTPKVKVQVYREGEAPVTEAPKAEAAKPAAAAEAPKAEVAKPAAAAEAQVAAEEAPSEPEAPAENA